VALVAQGFFITFEGGEGGGKSTQARRLADRLTVTGREVLVTREPGGSPGAEAIRALLVTGAAERWSPIAETLLMNAARRDHIEKVIAPALARGATVVCDRFADSTRAYQGAGGGAPEILIDVLETVVTDTVKPDLTFILDLPADMGLARASGRGGAETRFETKPLDFHNRLRAAFLGIAEQEPARCVLIDASRDEATVAAAVWSWVKSRIGPP
jgi:dTMP kinase